jgi:hypothetical protein
MINFSKRVFLAPACRKDKETLDQVLKILQDHKFPDKNIVKSVDMDMLTSGDYLLRCHDNDILLYEIQLTLPFGYTTNLVKKLNLKT